MSDSVLQCVAVRCSVWQCVGVVEVCCSVLQCVVLQIYCVAQGVAVSCSELQ